MRMIGESKPMREVIEYATKFKDSDAPLLIQGASGTGKEWFARYTHSLSQNSHKSFIVIDCHTVSQNLIESELFGHEAGSFSNQTKLKIGKFELARGGVILLKNTEVLTSNVQNKIQQVLQSKKVYRLGAFEAVNVSFRLMVSSNELVFFGVKGDHLILPPLKDRMGDMEMLVDGMMYDLTGHTKSVHVAVLAAFKVYSWPGNIKELKSLLESLCVTTNEAVIVMDDLPNKIKKAYLTKHPVTQFKKGFKPQALKDYVKEAEVGYIHKALKLYDGNVTKTAKVLQVSRSTIYNVMNRYAKS